MLEGCSTLFLLIDHQLNLFVEQVFVEDKQSTVNDVDVDAS